ncbi:MAG: M48 family metalloprotease [Novosphingobium sp.]|nr:M48 family metalloprotease [Novosphingobium sp.]
MLHDIAGFPEAARASVARYYGLTYGFGIRRIVPESPAALARLEAGDEIIAVNGADLERFMPEAIGRFGTSARTDAFFRYLDLALRMGAARLSVRRGSAELEIWLKPESGCGGRMSVVEAPQLNAWSNGEFVTLSTRMMRFATSDDGLAFVVAHEMAHNILNHNLRSGQSNGLLSRPSKRQGGKGSELAADRLAVAMVSEAGFDPGAARQLLERTPGGGLLAFSISHPGKSRRIKAVAAEIEAVTRARAERDRPMRLALQKSAVEEHEGNDALMLASISSGARISMKLSTRSATEIDSLSGLAAGWRRSGGFPMTERVGLHYRSASVDVGPYPTFAAGGEKDAPVALAPVLGTSISPVGLSLSSSHAKDAISLITVSSRTAPIPARLSPRSDLVQHGNCATFTQVGIRYGGTAIAQDTCRFGSEPV